MNSCHLKTSFQLPANFPEDVFGDFSVEIIKCCQQVMLEIMMYCFSLFPKWTERKEIERTYEEGQKE